MTDELDEDNPIEASMTATEFFRLLEECDSKRVHDFWELLDDTLLEIMNTHGRWTTDERDKGC